MKDEIKEKIKAYYMGNDIDEVLDCITNLRTIEQQYSAILSENAELENKITNLQESEAYYYGKYIDYKSRCEKSLKALHNSKEYKVMKELEFNKNMSILIKLDKLLGGDDNE